LVSNSLYSAIDSRLGRWYSTVIRDARFDELGCWGREDDEDMSPRLCYDHTPSFGHPHFNLIIIFYHEVCL
jgi:hypothetical protein